MNEVLTFSDKTEDFYKTYVSQNCGLHRVINKIIFLKNTVTNLGIQMHLEYKCKNEAEIFFEKTENFYTTYVW